MKRLFAATCAVLMVTVAAGCAGRKDATNLASGYVEATNVRVSSKVAGRIAQVTAVEGARVEADAVLATLATTDLDFALDRARAERAQAAAMLSLLQAGALPEGVLTRIGPPSGR